MHPALRAEDITIQDMEDLVNLGMVPVLAEHGWIIFQRATMKVPINFPEPNEREPEETS